MTNQATKMALEVVILEDSYEIKENIEKVLESKKIKSLSVDNSDDAVSLAIEGSSLFILDIRGKHSKQEGLDALEQIKAVNPKAFVGIYSAFPQNYKRKAMKLGADIFVTKTAEHRQNIESIVFHYLYAFFQSSIHPNKKVSSTLPHAGASSEFKENLNAFLEYKSDKTWFIKHHHRYVAFIDGKFIESDVNRDNLSSRLLKKYEKEIIFITKLETKEDIEDIPSLFLEG